jgi:D-lactate dehydrogenase
MSTASPALTASLDPRELGNALAQIIEPERVLTRPIERIAYAADASFYRLIPQAVILAKGVEDIQRLFRFSQEIGRAHV